MKATTLTLLAVAALLAGCGGGGEPAAPPTQEDALTTVDPAPTTQEPVEDAVATSAPPDDVSVTTEAGGPPEMPELAREDSEAGAGAFAAHFIAVMNYTAQSPEVGVFPSLSSQSCEVCTRYEETVAYSAEHNEIATGDIVAIEDSVALYSPVDSTANVRVAVRQIEQDFVNSEGDVVDHVDETGVTMAFTLAYDDGWTVESLRIEPRDL